MRTTTHTDDDDRGVSELLGVVLLFGIVIAGSAMIFVSGTAVSDDVRAQGRVDAAETAFVEMDASVQSLAQQRGSNQEAVSMGAVDPNRAEIRETGQIQIQINSNSACTATMDLSALEYADADGTTVAYEGGAIWKRTESGLVTEKSPELDFQGGALQLQVVRIDGSVEDDDMTIDYDRAESVQETQDVRDDLFAQSSCRRPNTIALTVESDYHEGWQRHLESRLPDSATVTTTGSQTVTATVPVDAEYDVIDFVGPGPGMVVDTDDGDDHVVLGAASPLYRGGATGSDDGPDYAGTVTFLGAEHATTDTTTVPEDEEVRVPYDASYTETVDVEMSGTATVEVTNRYWEWDNRTEDVPPLEVSFVLDESGSMGQYAPGSYDTKLEKARSATRTFLDVMDADDGHRVNLIGYDYGYGSPTLYQSFTQDQWRVEERLYKLTAGGSTDIPSATEASVDQFEDDGTDVRNKVMVLLTDGQDKSDRDPVAVARRTIPDDVTVYTIGVGEDVNDDVLREVAAAGGEDSKYIQVEDPEELESVFEEIAKDETTIPNKQWTTETVTKEVDLTEMGEDEVTVTETIPKSADVWPGDTVTVEGSVRASDSATLDRTVTVQREISGPNGTTSVAETRTVDVAFSGSERVTISGEHEVTDERTETVEVDRTVNVIEWPAVSMALSNQTDTVDLWSGANVNAPSDAVERGAYANFWGDAGATITFEPRVRACTDSSRTDETIEHDGTEYAITRCDAYGPVGDGSATVHVFANGDEVDVPGSADWQTSLEEMLSVDGTQYYVSDDGDLQAANLDSNQVLVVVEASDAAGQDANNVVMLVEVGESTTESSGEHLVNVEVTSVSAESESDDD